jgi:hypothetical protein
MYLLANLANVTVWVELFSNGTSGGDSGGVLGDGQLFR